MKTIARSAAILFLLLFLANHVKSQNNYSKVIYRKSQDKLSGFTFDASGKIPLPYATICVLHKKRGVISNEKGFFTLNINGLNKQDTLCFQYIGYYPKYITIGNYENNRIVLLKKNVVTLSEAVIFGNIPDPVKIIHQIIKNKDKNYKKNYCIRKVFIRFSNLSDIDNLRLNYKKSTISELNKNVIARAEKQIPHHSVSFNDFMGNLYFSANKKDSVKIKIDPIKNIQLQEKKITEIQNLENIFDTLFLRTKKNEYWKIKTGILGGKVEIDNKTTDTKKDSLHKNDMATKYFYDNIKHKWENNSLDDKSHWEFLYKTGKYKYTIAGITQINGREVYIIDFEPDKSGKYAGRMFVSKSDYALIKADYGYAPGKTGINIHLFGVGYSEYQYKNSIYFEKKDSSYQLKYFSLSTGNKSSFNRKLSLIKKRNRFFFDKTLNDIKIGLKISVKSIDGVELLVLNEKPVSRKQFIDFKEAKQIPVIFVNQFNDSLWQNNSIIAPTKILKDYKKKSYK